MENQKKQPLNKKLLAGAVALIAAVAVLAAVHFGTRPAASAGEKTITVTVAAHGEEEAFTIETDEEYLRGALESIDLIEGSESEYGLFVTAVNGIAADDSKQEWWCFTKGGEEMMTGVDTTPIADGDAFEITLTEGY